MLVGALILAGSSSLQPPSVSASPTSPNPTSAASPTDEPRRWLFETDEYNLAALCYAGQNKGFDHRETPCRLPRKRTVTFPGSSGGVTLTLWASRSTWESDGGNGMHEDVVVLNERGQIVHTLVQWDSSSTDGETNTLRRRFRFADLSGEGADGEMCVESVTQVGPDRIALLDVKTFRARKRFVGYDAFSWNGSRFARSESLDGSCPTTGYRLFVALPLTADVVHQSRGR